MIDETKYVIREDKIDNVDKWLWLKTDSGAWDGPKRDWETSHKEKILKYVINFNVVVQAGGNQGMYPRLLSDMFKTVYTFEPSHMNFYQLVYNCIDKKNIIMMNAALGNEHKMIEMNGLSDTNTGTHRVSYTDNAIVPQFKVDDLNLQNCDLLMLDVEGHEKYVIEGALNTIEKFKPVIFAENGGPLIDIISPYGYSSTDQSVSDTIYVYKG